MGSNFASEDGHASERLKAYYEERAKGGVGLIILETSAVSWPAGSSMPNMIGYSEDRFIPDLQDLTSRVHQYGAKIAAQLNHSGKISQEDVVAGREIPVPSIPKMHPSDMFGLLTEAEIMNFIKAAGLMEKVLDITNLQLKKLKTRLNTLFQRLKEQSSQVLMPLKFMPGTAI